MLVIRFLLTMLQLIEIGKTYLSGITPHVVLNNFSLDVSSGETVAIMGRSGSGKTTLLNLVGLLDKPTSGKYLLFGKDVTSFSDVESAKLRNEIFGFVFQQFFLLPRHSVFYNVAMPLLYRQECNSTVKEKVIRVLDEVGLSEKANSFPNQLSGGQQQRVAIARAMVGNPSVILADEPTGSLDSKTGQMILNNLLDLNRNSGKTVIIITHDQAVAASCHRIIHIKDGEIVS